VPKQIDKNYAATVLRAHGRFSKELGLVGTLFVVTLTLANLVHQLFGIRLLPFFQASFAAFHEWCRIVLHVFVFSWATSLVEWLWYGTTWVVSLLLPIIAWRPHIVIPPIVSDIALVSAAFTRVFGSTDLIVPRRERADAEAAMLPAQWKEIEKLEGPLLGPVHRLASISTDGLSTNSRRRLRPQRAAIEAGRAQVVSYIGYIK